jgi:hypothetical protein
MKYWTGDVGSVDDFDAPIVNVFYDAATTMGSWAIMSPRSFSMYGRGVGQGVGQKYERQPDGKWLKVLG